MATYGKKKRSILPSFSVLRDSDAESKPKKGKSKKRGSIAFTMPAFHDSNYKKESPSNKHDDSIEEMASILLDDTTIDQLKPEGGKRMSQSAASKAIPGLPRIGSQDGKNLPQLPALLFNGDDAWAMRMAPVVTAAGRLNQVDFGDGANELPQFSTQPSGHARKSSIPAIPRKSSKRKSGRPKSTLPQPHTDARDCRTIMGVSRQTLKSNISPPNPIDIRQPKKIPFEAADINGKIEAMIAATKVLKPDNDGALLQGPLVPTKKRRLVGNKVLAKVKTAINDRLQARSDRKRDSIRDDRLLDSSLNEAPDFEDESSASAVALTTMELRMNEGDNFKNPKIFTLTGHGNVRRKPLAEDGKSLRSRKSADHADDPFSEPPHSSGITRTPTSFENRLRDDISYDQGSEYIPDLPSRYQTPKYTPQDKKVRTSLYGGDFDAMLSSSPFSQSTPRIRLEPTFEEDGKTTLRHVPADSRSLFDPENSMMDIDSSTLRKDSSQQEPIKRKKSLLKDYGVKDHHSKKVKKHPSPSKAELEGLERALENFLPHSSSEVPPLQDNKSCVGRTLAPAAALALKDANKKLQGNKRHALKLEPMKTTESMPNLPSRPKKSQPDSIPDNAKTVEGLNRRFLSQNDIAEGSMMDIDELQWDNTAYHIGMKKA